MRTPKGKNYCTSIDELDQYRKRLKLESCPHCRAIGYLIGHGFMRGYGEQPDQREVQGRRFFCSNRDRRAGCGHTFSVLLANRLRTFMILATTLWLFMKAVRSGLSRKAAWEGLQTYLSLETGYRIWKRLERAQTHIRIHLHHHCDPPAASITTRPLFELIDHLIDAFGPAEDPISAFQMHVQEPFLP